jgi:hypothetical protein
MVKKAKAKKTSSAGKAKKGDKYVCNSCGMTVKVDEPCGCDSCAVTCCGEPMECC